MRYDYSRACWTRQCLCNSDSSRNGATRVTAIDLFTDTAAILNLLDLRSIMGCPGGTCSVFTRAFRAKRELQCIFLGKRRALLHPNTAQRSFFSHYNLFLGKLQEKFARKARVNTERVL